MTKRRMYLNNKELIVAASAAAALGLGTTISHSTLVQASNTDTNSTVTTQSDSDSETANDENTGVAASTDTTTSSNNSGTSSSSLPGNDGTSNTSTTNNSNTNTQTQTSVNNGSASNTTQTTDNVPTSNIPTTTSSETTNNSAPAVSSTGTTTTNTEPASNTSGDATTNTNSNSTIQPVSETVTTPTSAANTYNDASDFSWDTSSGSAIVTGVNTGVTTVNLAPNYTINGTNYDVSGIGANAFIGNKEITSITLNDGITDIGDSVFGYMPNLTTVDLSNAKSLTTIGNDAFAGDDSLTNVTLPDNLQTIGDGAFIYDKALKTIKIPSGVTSIGNQAFQQNSSLTTVDFSDATALQTIGDNAFDSDPVLSSVDLSGATSLTSIGDNAFVYDNSIQSVKLPASLQTIGVNAFASSNGLSEVDFSNATSLTTIGDNAFGNDPKITTLTFPANLETIGYQAFSNDLGLTTINFAPEGNLKTIGDQAFVYDNSLTELNLPDSLTEIGADAFLGNTSLSSVTLGKNLTTIGDQAFTYDHDLTSLDTSKATSLTTIGNGSFEYTGLTGTLTIPANVTSIGNDAFAGDDINDLNLNDKLQTIGNSAFAFNKLTDLEIPKSVTQIGDSAFISNLLESLTIDGIPTVGETAFSNNRITKISAPDVINDENAATDQFAAIFTDSAHNSISDYFDVDINGYTEKNMSITNLTNGVTYNNGTFTIPTGVTSFSFDWVLSNGTSDGNGYSGTYDVYLDNPQIKVIDSKIPAGSSWDPADNFVSAVTPDGTDVPLDNLTVSITDPSGKTVDNIDTTQIGNYTVTYSYGNESNTVTVAVYKRDGTYDITGNKEVTYSGDAQTLNSSDYNVTLSDGTNIQLSAGDLVFTNDGGSTVSTSETNAGTYKVVLTAQGLSKIENGEMGNLYNWSIGQDTATLVINKADVTIKANDFMKVIGTSDPEFTVTITNPASNGTPLVYAVTRPSGETKGTYPIEIEAPASDNPNYNITTINGTLTITDNSTINGSDYTMNVGDPTPTASDFNATATDNSGNAESVTPDLSKVDFNTAGTYDVTLTSASGLTKVVKLTLVAKDVQTDPSLSADDYTMNVGDPTPTALDFNAKATNAQGVSESVQVDLNSADLTKAGTYDVTLSSASGLTKVVKLTVLEPNTDPAPTLSGSDYTMHIGDPTPTATDFNAVATDNTGANEKVTVDLNSADLTKAGTYNVTLSSASGLTKIVKLTVLEPNTDPAPTLNGSDYTMHIGDPTPTASDFNAVATDNSGTSENIKVDLSAVDFNTPGVYNVKLLSASGLVKNVKLTILASETDTVTPVDPTDPETPIEEANADSNDGIYYVPSATSDKAGSLIVSDQTMTNKVTSMMQNQNLINNTKKFPQTGNDSGIAYKILGAIMAALTIVGIDVKKRRN